MKTLQIQRKNKTFKIPVDDEDYCHLNRFKWHLNRNRIGGWNVVRQMMVNGKECGIAMWRFIKSNEEGKKKH